jgi:uncharacterized membrane protein YeaQ/YmgE (transglycosylase-associated protein family)
MAILHCLWIGGLAGLVASRLIRGRLGVVPVASSVAVGVLGALLGALVEPWIAGPWIVGGASSWQTGELLAAAVGAAATLGAWAFAQRTFLANPAPSKPADGSFRVRG